MSDFDAWIGREQTNRDRLTPERAFQWCATFDLPRPQDVLPQGVHFILCPPDGPTAA